MSTTNVVCPSCNVTNRLPSDRLHDSPVCGKCKQALFKGEPIILDAANLNQSLRHNDVPVLVDCWAPWCAPCRSFAPTFQQAAAAFEPAIRLAKLNTEDHPSVASAWQIRSIPTLILFNQGREISRVSGAFSLGQLKQWLEQNGVRLP